MPVLIKGTDLTPAQRKMVLNAYVHRHLGKAAWPTDDSFVATHAFWFLNDGSRLSRTHQHCEPEYMAEKQERLTGENQKIQ